MFPVFFNGRVPTHRVDLRSFNLFSSGPTNPFSGESFWVEVKPTKQKTKHLENIVYHCFRQLWLVLGVKLMEINSNLFSRQEANHKIKLLQTDFFFAASTGFHFAKKMFLEPKTKRTLQLVREKKRGCNQSKKKLKKMVPFGNCPHPVTVPKGG